jgi:hypothetical protein
MPLLRLGAFLAVFALAGNAMFFAIRRAAPVKASPDRRVETFSRMRVSLERRLGPLQGVLLPDEVPKGSGESPASGPSRDPRASEERAPRDSQEEKRVGALERLPRTLEWESGDLHFEWPEALPATPIPAPLWSPPGSSDEDSWLRLRMATERPPPAGVRTLSDVGEIILFGPGKVLDEFVLLAEAALSRRVTDEESVTAHFLDFHVERREGRVFTDFTANFMERERRFFAGFESSYLDTTAFEEFGQDIDRRALFREQRKVLIDSLKGAYFSRYRVEENRFREEAFTFDRWHGLDFVALPPLALGYFYYRGLERRIAVGETWLYVSVDPLSQWVSGRRELISGASLFWTLRGGWPVGLIVSTGLYDGAVKIDFVGLGTSAGMAKKALYLERE